MSRAPKISVCLPVFNGEQYLRLMLDSVLAQTFGDFEFLISDNCSTDRTKEVCLTYAAQDRRIVYTRNDRNIGVNANNNLLVHRAQGKYIALFGHDDIVRPAFLEKCLSELERDSGLLVCHSLTQHIDSNGEPATRDHLGILEDQPRRCPYELRLYTHVAEGENPVERFRPFGRGDYWGDHNYGLIRRSALVGTHLFGPYFGSDMVLMAELALMGRFKTIDEILFLRRIHQAGTHFMSPDRRREYATRSQRRRFKERLANSWYFAGAVISAENLSLLDRVRCLGIVGGRATYSLRRRLF